MLRKRHRAGVKPAVNDLRDSLHAVPAAFRAGAHKLVDIGSVQLYGQSVLSTGHLLQLLAGTDADLFSAVLALPDRKRSSPVTVAADAPVLNIFQPVAETAGADRGRNPVDRIVVRDQLVTDLRHLDEPGLTRIVDQRSVAAPAVRIFMLELRSVKQLALMVQVTDDNRICLLDKHSAVGRIRSHVSGSVYELDEGKVIVAADASVILTKRRSDMNDAGTVRHGDIIVAGHKVAGLMLFCRSLSCCLEQRLIGTALQIGTHIGLQHFVCLALRDTVPVIGVCVEFHTLRIQALGHRSRYLVVVCLADLSGNRLVRQLAEDLVCQCLGKDIGVAVRSLHLDVGLGRVHAQSDVAGECPRSRGPCQIVYSLLIGRLEAYDRGALFDQLVPLGYFL